LSTNSVAAVASLKEQGQEDTEHAPATCVGR